MNISLNKTSRSAQVTSKLEVSVISAGPDFSLEDRIWAVNWFDVESKWLYDFYNVLAVPHVLKVGGAPFFKGRLKKRLFGESYDEREVCLIVTYPNADGFLKMLKNKVFQLKSLIRESAVKDFTFGFMKRLDDGESPKKRGGKYDGKLIYMIHHFKNASQFIDSKKIKEFAASNDIFVHYSGIKSALIGRKKFEGQLKTVPFLMDGILVFGAFESDQFDHFINTDFYQEFIGGNQSNYIALFNREY